MNAQNLDDRFPPRTFSPVRSPSAGSGVLEHEARVGDVGEWHLDIDRKEHRWESYVKAGYYVGVPTTYPKILDSQRDAFVGRSH